MSEFDYNLKPNKNSASKRNLLYGVGINNAEYKVCQIVDGKSVIDKYYKKWSAMLERCYCEKSQNKRPGYIGCTVCKEWLTFSNFKNWMESQDWKGKHLNKDILVLGYKIYSPETCLFVTGEINLLLTNHAYARGVYPQGVSWHKRIKKYSSSISKYGKRNHIGYYDLVSLAEKAYKKAKSLHLKEVAMSQHDIKLKNALLRISAELRVS